MIGAYHEPSNLRLIASLVNPLVLRQTELYSFLDLGVNIFEVDGYNFATAFRIINYNLDRIIATEKQ